jgi:signal peptidase I
MLAAVLVAAQVLYWMNARVVRVRAYRVPTGAMSPIIKPGERVVVVLTSNAKAGDIIAFRYPIDLSANFVSRVVAVAGETVEIRDQRLFIDGREINEPYVVHDDTTIYPKSPVLPEPYRSRDQFGPFRVPAGHYFTLGDNRDHSHDGRFWGAVPANNVTGRVILIYSSRGLRRPPAFSRTPRAPSPR